MPSILIKYRQSPLFHMAHRVSMVSNVLYSGDPKTGLVRFSNGPKLFGYEMVRFSNAIRKPDNVRFSNGINLGPFKIPTV